ncbi:MAG: D-alanyl-D-alanine carboxypeptidase [Alphaproteobacteria bacterium CG_4_9_14_3_um_filter_47_13]|nr:MAG: D-alanyl-D-alanine carboxypeptidase [Alphaproteobacteria bacterium CG_4_9_14_3_um_filter_47_13]
MAFFVTSRTKNSFSDLSLKFLLAFAFFVFGLSCLTPPPALANGNPRYASIVMDAESGRILHERYADKSLHPASLVKMMTLLMAFEAIEKGEISLRDRITVSKYATTMIPSKLDLPAGSTIRVEDAIYALVTKSANDIAVAIGEKIGGSESRFADQMTKRAHEIGMNRTYFKNASGLHHPGQVSSARDMAKLGQFIIRNYPKYYDYFSTRNFTYMGKSYHNHNRLMESYPGMDGFKTGYIGASGFNLVASVKRNNNRLIGVVFGGQTASSRNAHMKQLLDQSFKELDDILVAKSMPIPEHKPKKLTRLSALAPQDNIEDMGKWADLNPMLQNKAFQALIGEGDYDPAETRRFETGLLAVAAVKGVYDDQNTQETATPALTSRRTGNWSIQVGAFESRVKTDKAIKIAQQSLQGELAQASAVIVPLRTQKGWLFRGRLDGYSKDEALRACAQLKKDCLPISPQAH